MDTPIQRLLRDPKRIETLFVNPDDEINECIVKMHTLKVSAVIISKNDELLGIFTEHDLLNNVYINDVNVNQPISTVMSTDLITTASSATIKDVLSIMIDNNIRHLPVIDDGVLKDMLSISEVNKAMLLIQEGEIHDLTSYIQS